MRDEPRRPSSRHPVVPPPESAPDAAAPRASRHPALRPRLGDVREDDLRAFSSSAHAPEQAPAGSAQLKDEHEPLAEPSAAAARARGGRRDGAGTSSAPTASEAASIEASGGKPYKRVRRPRRSFGPRLKQLTLCVLLPGAVAGGAGWALASPQLSVSSVEISGVSATPDVLVRPISTALLGQNWLRADLAAARSRLAKLPTVEGASVSRAWNHWPPRLSVRIRERQPWLRLGGGADWWVVDKSGVAFRRATRQDRELYAVTSTAFEPEALRAGQPVPPKIWDGVRRLAQALEQSSQQGRRWQLRRAYLDRDNMASLRLRGGAQDGLLVRLGDGQWPQKMSRARRALLFFEAAGRRAQSLNLVSFSMPTWTPFQPPPAALNAPAEANSAGAGTSAQVASPAEDASTADPTAAPTTPPDAPATAPGTSEGGSASTSGSPSTSRASTEDGPGTRSRRSKRGGSRKRAEPGTAGGAGAAA